MAKLIKITAKELLKISIWENKHQLASARGRGLIILIKENGKQYYDLNSINKQFLKPINQPL